MIADLELADPRVIGMIELAKKSGNLSGALNIVQLTALRLLLNYEEVEKIKYDMKRDENTLFNFMSYQAPELYQELAKQRESTSQSFDPVDEFDFVKILQDLKDEQE